MEGPGQTWPRLQISTTWPPTMSLLDRVLANDRRDWWVDRGRSVPRGRSRRSAASGRTRRRCGTTSIGRCHSIARACSSRQRCSCGRLRAEPERHHRGGPGDERDEPPESEDAEPRWVRPRSPAGCPKGTPTAMNARPTPGAVRDAGVGWPALPRHRAGRGETPAEWIASPNASGRTADRSH